ncbi:DUF222 domain-containing protein [Agromyces tardus]|nr:HNH endonuclease signature motif containing protein [Agromyces tardus]
MATPLLESAADVSERALIDEVFVGEVFDEVFVTAWADEATMAGAAAGVEAALAADLALLESLERTIRWAQAEQYRVIEAARVRHAQIEGVTEVSSPAQREFATRSFVAEIATTLVVPEAAAGRFVADAGRLTGARAATLEALAAGAVSVGHVRSMLEITQTMPADAAGDLERLALADAAMRTSAAFRGRVHRLRERLHPASLSERRARAAEDRRVALDSAPDGMAWLSLFLQAERAVAIVERLDALAAASDPDRPDCRTRAQRAADVAGDLLLAGTLDAADHHLAAATGRVAAQIVVTVPVLSLLGVTDEPAELDGYGPIDAETARRLAAHAPSVQRLLVHPETGAALSYSRTRYRVAADLAGYLRVRDGRCRFPGCARRARHADLDHIVAWAQGGSTSAENLAHLCRAHHRLKHESGWRMAHEPDGVIRWTSPVGHVLRTLPERPFLPVPGPTGSRPPSTPPNPQAPTFLRPDADPDPPWLHAASAAA